MLGLALRTRLALVLAAIALYVPLAGGGPSIQRAGVMGAAAVVAVLAGRPAARWHALLLATAVTLALNPRAVEDVGWQLSFAAVLAILLLAGRVRDGLVRRGLPRGLAEATALTGAATLGTAPLIAAHFGQASLVSLPANVLAAPAVAPAMWLAMIAVALGQLGTALAAPFVALAAFPVAYVMWVAHVASGVPGARASVPAGLVGRRVRSSGPGGDGAPRASAARGGRRRGAGPRPRAVARAQLAARGVARAHAAAGLAALVSRASAAGLAAPAGLRITFLDVGQGDATLIQWRRSAILVDTGPPDGPILTRLRHAGVRRLDLLVVTHAQADHDGGAAAVLRALPVGLVLDGRDGIRDPSGLQMAAQAARRGVRTIAARAGEVLRVGAIALRVLWPASARGPADAGADPNQRAIVAEADAGGVRTLLTADAESDVLAGLDLGPVDVLKVSHHGSADPGLPALLQRLRPRLAAIEVGRHNVYGHPAAATVRALLAAGAALVRTDRDGSVTRRAGGRGVAHPRSCLDSIRARVQARLPRPRRRPRPHRRASRPPARDGRGGVGERRLRGLRRRRRDARGHRAGPQRDDLRHRTALPDRRRGRALEGRRGAGVARARRSRRCRPTRRSASSGATTGGSRRRPSSRRRSRRRAATSPSRPP